MKSHAPDDYYALGRAEMLEFVRGSPGRVLELGAGSGGFLAHVRRRLGPHAELWAVEPHASPTPEARAAVNHWYPGDLDAFLADHRGRSEFDLIVMNDVLEHLPDTWTSLDDVGQLLAPSGELLLSVPNARSPRLIVDIVVFNDFRYRESGVLDRTHLRFFTSRSIARTLREASYEVVLIGPINSVLERRVPHVLATGLDRLFPTFTHRQIAVLARRGGPATPQ